MRRPRQTGAFAAAPALQAWRHASLQRRQACPTSARAPARLTATRSSLSRDSAAQDLMEKLRKDLLQQYDRPFALDFSIYTPDVLFTDPMTRLRSRFLYQGMLVSIAGICWTLFRPGTVSFELDTCEYVAAEDGAGPGCIRTVFRTAGETRWAARGAPPFVISGVDRFHLVEGKAPGTLQIAHHESTWDQTPEEVSAGFVRRS